MSDSDPHPAARLNLGCGRSPLEGWINVDSVPLDGVDVLADLDACAHEPLPFADDSIDEFVGRHVLEHIGNTLPLMQELHRIARAGAPATFYLPHGASDDAHEDPTHARQYFLQSFGYFSQPYYWRADYGYRGDWQPERITLHVASAVHGGRAPNAVLADVMRHRNVVLEMVAELRAVKPIREPRRELQAPPQIVIVPRD